MKLRKTFGILLVAALFMVSLAISAQQKKEGNSGDVKSGTEKKEKVEKKEKTGKKEMSEKKEGVEKKEKEEKKEKKDSVMNSGLVSGLKLRSIGPAFTSGRIADFAVNPKNHDEWFVAVASGHLWKTVNNGTTFEPVFDNYGAYSMGTVVIDPCNTSVVWVGTGERNSQRALGYGDGVYKSIDGGKELEEHGIERLSPDWWHSY